MASVAHAGARFIAATRTVSVRNGAIQRRAGSIPDTTLTATRTVSVRNGAIQRRDWRRAEHQTVNRGDARADTCRVLQAEIAVRLRLGDLAVSQGWITHDDLAIALEVQQETGDRLGQILVDRGLLSEPQLSRLLAVRLGFDFVDLDEQHVDPLIGRSIRESFARRYQAVPVARLGDTLVVAMSNPGDVLALDDIRTLTRCEIRPIMADAGQIGRAIDGLWRHGSDAEDVLAEATQEAAAGAAAHDLALEVASARSEDAPVVRLVTQLIGRALHNHASDLHLHPTDGGLRVRLRVDGVLRDVMTVPRSLQDSVVSRMKIMAGMDIAERRLPQDGRVSVTIDGEVIDLRVVSIPTAEGETLVVRLLERHGSLLRIGELGFLAETLARYEREFRRTNGAILVTGPTGSGKSTTLYATLSEVNDADRNVFTVEDPIEYKMAGIRQVQVNAKAGLTFATALRSILRADPDIILVGEIRDHGTARIAIEAALTGHLVLSSLHTNNAASAPARLVDMGVEPFLVTSSMRAVAAQRLVRRLCDRCKQAGAPDRARLETFGLPSDTVLFRATGCSACGRTGYRGRFAIHEVLVLSDAIARLVQERAGVEEVQQLARHEGMITLLEDGLRKVARGMTTLEELARVVS